MGLVGLFLVGCFFFHFSFFSDLWIVSLGPPQDGVVPRGVPSKPPKKRWCPQTRLLDVLVWMVPNTFFMCLVVCLFVFGSGVAQVWCLETR